VANQNGAGAAFCRKAAAQAPIGRILLTQMFGDNSWETW
jgi:hypothetical protein